MVVGLNIERVLSGKKHTKRNRIIDNGRERKQNLLRVKCATCIDLVIKADKHTHGSWANKCSLTRSQLTHIFTYSHISFAC